MMKPHLIRLGLILSICVLALAAEAGMAEAATLRYREVLRLWIAENEAQAWTPDSGPTPTPIPRDVQTDLNPTLSFSWSADGQRLAVGYRDAVRIWDTVTGKVIRRIAHPGGTLPPDDPYTFPDPNAVDVAWSPDGQWLAVSVQGKVLIRDAESGNEIQDCGRLGDSTNLTWSADSKRLAGGVLNTPYANSSIHFCEVGSDTVPAIERVNYASVLAYSPNGQKLAAISDSYDFTPYVRIYDAVTLQLDATLQGHYALAWSPDGEKLATIGYEIQIRDAQSYLPLITIPNEAVVLAWHPKANRLIAGDFDGDLKVYDTESGALLTTIRNTAFGWHFLNGLGLPGAVKWSPEGARFAMQAGGFIRVYTESGGASAMTRPTARSGTPTLTPISATLTPHMAKLSTANPGRLHEITRAWRRMEGEVNPYYWSPDGSVGVMVVASEDLGEVWELSKVGDPESRLMIRLDNPTGWAFSPNGRFLP
jgi:WD40 repeat protein